MKQSAALLPVRPARTALAILLGALTGAGPAKPSLSAIEIVPGEVAIGPTQLPVTFELEARLWTGSTTDRLSIGETQGYAPLAWASDHPWPTVVGQTGFRATLQVGASTGPAGPALVRVTTADPTTSPPAKISIAPATIATEDVLTASYDPGKPPDVVVVNGIQVTGGACTQRASAFVAQVTLGNFVAPCEGESAGWGAAVVAPDRAVLLMAPAWTSGPDRIDAGTQQKPPLTLPIALHVMVGDNSLSPADLNTLQNDVLQVAQADIGASNTLLADARAGIQLAIVGTPAIASPGLSVADCSEGDTKTATNDVDTLLNVYYVNDLNGYRGVACVWHEGRHQDVIYVGWNDHSTTTLVHELGHTLGLMLPAYGHSDILAGFDVTNIMTSGLSDVDPVGRRRLTVGQVFRMNADPASWLNWAVDASLSPVRDPAAPRLACQCNAADAGGVCPPLITDVADRSAAPGTVEGWDCFDQLWLRNLPAGDEQPVAILAGRSWRSPPRTCSTDLPGLPEQHWQATYIRVANLTRPGICPSWAAIFFNNHGVLYEQLKEPAFGWTQAADNLSVNDAIPPPVDIAVTVEYPPAEDGSVKRDSGYASETFGTKNRTGINLKFTLKPSTTCSSTPTGATNLGVCYLQRGGPSEGSLVGSGRIQVAIGKSTATTLAHLIGQALGLQPLGSSDPAFPQNIMQPLATDRGQKLTLGQVFRIHLPLNASLPRCSSDPAACPSLAADVTP